MVVGFVAGELFDVADHVPRCVFVLFFLHSQELQPVVRIVLIFHVHVANPSRVF